MTAINAKDMREPAMLRVGDGSTAKIVNQASLSAKLSQIDKVDDGQVVILQRRQNHYIKAVRKGSFWSVSFRKGPFWTLNGFSAEGTTEYSDRKVKESRRAGSLLERFKLALLSPAPANALTSQQVKELFEAYFLGAKFPISAGIGTG